MQRVLIVCTTDSMIWNFLIPHIRSMERQGMSVECACSRTGVYLDELISEYGLTVYELPFQRSPYSLKNITAYRHLVSLIRLRRYDTIFCHEPVGGAIGRLAGRKTGCKVIYMAHGFHFYRGAPKRNWLIYYPVEIYLSRLTDLLITINREDYEAAKRMKASDVALVNGVGVHTGQFHAYETDCLRTQFGLKKDDFILLTVGELIPRKNHKLLIQAISKMGDPEVHLFIAGAGKLEHELRGLTEKHHLDANVHMLGFCRNVTDLCNACDAFIFPSLQEGLSVALMEAMACKKPVIASRIRGNVDLIEHKKGGLLVKAKDQKGYQRAIQILKENQKLCSRFGDYNAEKIKKYDIQHVEQQFKKLYLNM
ncbi:glycosyltransferase family 1 protein [Clostridiaceae bacterium]|jgi:glycosyltransferase involved in cell wall biosynthesis|nr:glycosyltransferase family 1 protein [Clostridiaceae bacterium]